MTSRLVLIVRLLAGIVVAALPGATVQARQVELLQFGGVVDRLVIDVGRHPDRTPAVLPVSDDAPVALSGLREEFSALSLPIQQPAIAERSTIPVPLWLRTGQPATRPYEALAVLSAAGVRTSTCSLAPYRPRGDLSGRVEQRRAILYPLVSAIACEAGVPVGLFDALVAQESGYDPMIVSPKGAVGLTQLMPGTAARLGVSDLRDPVQNLRGGARYLRTHLDEFGRVDLALAAYNAGPGRVRSGGRIPAITETLGYVAAIIRGWSAGTRYAAAPRSSTHLGVDGDRGVLRLAFTATNSLRLSR